MTSQQLYDFMTKHTLSPEILADMLGLTPGAVNHWLFGRRKVPPTIAKLLNFFDRNPNAMKVF
jgi:transcriptional regulator with XRE-family HTH domain